MVTIHLRTTERGDSGNIVRLLGGTNEWPGFDHKGTEVDYWEWRYSHNPIGFTNEIIAVSDGNVLSHAASLPTVLRIGQKLHLCAQLSDLYTDPGSRGQGLMESAMTALDARDREKGIELDFAFPSPAGYELTMKAGFMEMPVSMGHYELITNPGRFFSNVRFGKLKKMAYQGMRLVKSRGVADKAKVEVWEVQSFPDDISALTEEFEGEFDLVFHRDKRYLKWRFEQPEAGIFRIIVARKNGSTTGYAVLRPYRVSGHMYMDIVDLVAMPTDRESLTALIERSIELCLRDEANMLQVWLPTDHPFLPELGRLGFLLSKPMPGERRMRLVCRQLSDDALLAEQLKGNIRYHIVLGDSDWV